LFPDGRFRHALLALLIVLAVAPAGATPEPLLVAVGEVTDTSAVAWVRGIAAGEVSLEYAAAGGPATRAALSVGSGSDLTGKLRLAGLTPSTRYTYRAVNAGASGEGTFTTAPPPDVAERVRLVWGGDLGGNGHCRRRGSVYRIFHAMAASRPQFFLFTGDTVYADHVCTVPDAAPGAEFAARTLDEFRARHRHERLDPALSAFLADTPVYAIWDDHEVRNDFAGPHEPLMPVGRQAFLDYWPILPPDEEPGRLYRSTRWGRLLEVFILDTRQYRSANTEPDGPGKTMLGPAQRRWLTRRVAASDAVWKVVVSTVPLSVPTGRRGRDSWTNASVLGVPDEAGTGFAVERDAILRDLRERGVRNLVVLAADVHHAEVIRHHPAPGFVVHEFIAGPLSAFNGISRPLDQGLRPLSLFARGGVYNFGELTVEPGALTVRIIDADARPLFSRTIAPE
jgi:alkaline phosphatase D